MSDLLQPAREAAAEALEARLGGWGEHPVPQPTPDPGARPIVDVEAVRAELAGRALWWDTRCGRWQKVDVSPATQEAALREYVGELQDRADSHWRQTGAYARAAEAALAEAAELAADRRYDKARAERRDRARDRRADELIFEGYDWRTAQKIAQREIPEVE